MIKQLFVQAKDLELSEEKFSQGDSEFYNFKSFESDESSEASSSTITTMEPLILSYLKKEHTKNFKVLKDHGLL